MAFERIELNICPAGDMPVFHCSQYDVGRPIIIDLLNGEDVFTPTEGTTFELHCRKVDDNIVTLDTYEVNGNTLTFTSTEQLCACPGDNLCEVAIYLDDLCMGTLNFMLHVEPDPLAGGLESETQIHNLTEQVEEITEQVIGDNYYDKTEVDDLLDTKADAATTYTKTEVDTALNLKADKSTTYTKTETNNLLAGKADASDTYTKAQVDSKLSLKADKATTYTKTETDTLLGYKADASQVYTRSQTDTLLNDKADKSTTYTKTQVDNALALKADAATTYTKTQVDNALALKADAATTYTKTEVDNALALKANAADVYTKTETYTQAQVDAIIYNIFPIKTASGTIANFITALTYPLVSVTTAEGATNVTRCGVNLWDEQWEVGTIDTSTGQNTANPSRIRSIGYIKVIPGSKVRLIMPVDSSIYVLWYEYKADKSFTGFYYKSGGNEITVASDTTFVRFSAVGYGTEYNDDISINYPSTVNDYNAYTGVTKTPGEADTISTLVGTNNVFADVGDVTVQYKDTTL